MSAEPGAAAVRRTARTPAAAKPFTARAAY